MGYYDFPHTRNYDTDLGFLIEKYKEFVNAYNEINYKITEYLQKKIDNHELFLNAEYSSATKTLSFIFDNQVNETHLYNASDESIQITDYEFLEVKDNE